MANIPSGGARPLNVVVRRRSPAARRAYLHAGLPGRPAAAARVPGLPPTPAEDLRFRGGRTIADLTFTSFYVGGSGAWDPGDVANIDGALAAAMTYQKLNNVMMQYFNNRPITSTPRPSRVLPGAAAAKVSQGDVEAMVRAARAGGLLDGFDLASTLFNFMLPRGTVLTDNPAPAGGAGHGQALARSSDSVDPVVPHEDEADSLHGLGGYHGSVHAGADTLYYAVGVYSETRLDGTANGIPVFDRPWKNVVATFYHELNEARTDPDVEDAVRAGNDPSAERFLGWVSDRGEECGDFPVDEANPLTLVFQEVIVPGASAVPVQFQYSNAVHGPEGPIDAPHPLSPARHHAHA